MVYRNDVEALAARHAELEAEVRARIRERDGIAFMLLEARDRDAEQLRIADLLSDGPRRRRRRRMWIALRDLSITVCVLAAIAAAVFGGRYEDRVNREHERHARFVAAMDVMRWFTTRMCDCTTTTCVQQVGDQMTQWSLRQDKARPELAEAETQQMTDLTVHMATCMRSAMMTGELP